MNIPLSLLIYNPIEAYTLVLLCDIISGNNTNLSFRRIKIIWIFGAINLLIQLIPYPLYGHSLFAIINLCITYFIVPISVKYFYELCGNRISYKRCVISQLINSVFIVVVSSSVNMLFGVNTIFYNDNSLHEFIVNTIIYSLQISFYIFIKRRTLCYEKSN